MLVHKYLQEMVVVAVERPQEDVQLLVAQVLGTLKKYAVEHLQLQVYHAIYRWVAEYECKDLSANESALLQWLFSSFEIQLIANKTLASYK